jgi:hypothetical protein
VSAPNLEDELVDLLAPEGVTHDGAWEPDDAAAADWVARKGQRAAAALADLQAQRDAIVARTDAWLERERSRHDRTIAWAEDLLGRWLAREIAADDSKKPRKSRNLPSGVTVKRTAGRPRLVVEDHDALVEWLTSNEDTSGLVEPVWEFDANRVKALVLEDGVALKGAHVETGDDSYKVVFGGAA